MSLICYGLVLLGLMAIALAIYGVAMLGWCTSQFRPSHSDHRRPSRPLGESSLQPYLYSTFKYGEGVAAMNETSHHRSDCVLCLSGFEDGEDLRQLPRCMHFYHSPCIDMWLLSHSNCPLCRSQVDRPASCAEAEASERSNEAILRIRFST